MSLIPETSTLLTYTIACFVLFATPGPDMSLFLAKTVQGAPPLGHRLRCRERRRAASCIRWRRRSAWSALIAASAVPPSPC